MINKKIVICENEVIIRENLVKKLEEKGYDVVGKVDSGEEALEIAINEHPGLVIMDLHLKGDRFKEYSGTEFGNKIHNELNIPILYITGHTDRVVKSLLKEEKDLGNVLIKPINDYELFEKLDRLLEYYNEKSS